MSQAWDDVYHQLWRHAAHHRGLREATGELPGHTLSQSLRQWPRTCGADVVAIAAVIDPMLYNAPLETGGHGVERKWRRCTRQLTETALGEPTREYRHNREFWSTLASIAAYLASVGAPAPEAMWPALLAEIASRESEHRSTVTGGTLRLQPYSYDEMWREQHAALGKLRGADVRESTSGVSGGPMLVPHTTNADVLDIGMYWYEALARVGLTRRAQGDDGECALRAAGLDGEIRRVMPIFVDVDSHATGKDPDAIYPKNEEFWRGMASLAVTLAAIDPSPMPFEMQLSKAARTSGGRRNASYPGAGSFEQRWDKQHDDFIEARGFDLRDHLPDRVGRPMKIPRTLNAEIAKLANDWNAAWKKLDDRRGIFGNLPGEEVGLDTLEKRWKAVMKDVHEIAEPSKVDDVYPKNHEFWRETRDLAQTLDGYNEIPSRFDIAIDVARTLPDRLANVVGDVMKAVGNIAHKAGEGVASGLGKPILIGGSVVLGGILLWRLARRPRVAEAA